jgi:hypothetical protein
MDGKVILTAHSVNRWLPTAAARVRSHVRSCGIFGGQSGTGVGFPRQLWFPLSILTPSTAPHSSSSIIRDGTIGQIVADVPSGLSQPHPPPNEFKKGLILKRIFTK